MLFFRVQWTAFFSSHDIFADFFFFSLESQPSRYCKLHYRMRSYFVYREISEVYVPDWFFFSFQPPHILVATSFEWTLNIYKTVKSSKPLIQLFVSSSLLVSKPPYSVSISLLSTLYSVCVCTMCKIIEFFKLLHPE